MFAASPGASRVAAAAAAAPLSGAAFEIAATTVVAEAGCRAIIVSTAMIAAWDRSAAGVLLTTAAARAGSSTTGTRRNSCSRRFLCSVTSAFTASTLAHNTLPIVAIFLIRTVFNFPPCGPSKHGDCQSCRNDVTTKERVGNQRLTGHHRTTSKRDKRGTWGLWPTKTVLRPVNGPVISTCRNNKGTTINDHPLGASREYLTEDLWK